KDARPLSLAQFVKDLGHAYPRVVHVSLQLAERFRTVYWAAIRVNNGVSGILPTLILITLRRASCVFLEAVSISITIAVDPFEAFLGSVEIPLKKTCIPLATPRHMKDDEVKHCCIGSSVIRRVWDGFEMRKLAKTQLVHDLAWL